MKSRVLIISFVFLLTFCVVSALSRSEVRTSKLKIIPVPGSGTSQADVKGAKVAIGGTESFSGTLDPDGVLVDSGGNFIFLGPGQYSLTLTLVGYETYKTTLTVEEPAEGMPPLDISLHVSLKKIPVAGPGGGGGGGSPSGDKDFWGWLTAALVVVIGVLGAAILIVIRRRQPAYAGGAAASPVRTAETTPRPKRRTTEASPAVDEEPDIPTQERFTGKRFGRYLVTKTIAWGGMASVLEAQFEKGGKTVKAALKVPYDNYQRDDEFIGRFDQEARLGDILFHENIIGIYEYGVTKSGVRFIAMQYIDGTDLRKVLAKAGRIDPARAAQIVMDIAKALDYAHGQSPPVYHRDIKPENILFRDKKGEGSAILTDFGIATQGGTMGTGKALIGTALYSCPDSARGLPVGPTYDIYSLGVVFYEILTGKQPFSGADYYAIMRRHEEDRPVPPGDIAADVPGELEAMVMKMLEKDPKARYQSAKELLVELRDFLTR